LRQQILGLREMNIQMSKETINLTKKETVRCKEIGENCGKSIEKSGLEKDANMKCNKALPDEGNRVFPDVVINLPDGKKMIVDSKVSLTAYEKYINEDDDLKVGI
jgi:DNA recombination protein RmuC